MWVPRRAGNGVQWQGGPRVPDGGESPEEPRWRSRPRWSSWSAPPDGARSRGSARHRHRLTTIKTKSAAVGSHEYWMGGRARTGTLLCDTTTTTLDTRYRKYLTRGVGNKWHSEEKSWRKVLEILKRTLFGLKNYPNIHAINIFDGMFSIINMRTSIWPFVPY